MGIYYEYPAGTVVHESPLWQIRSGYLNQDTGEVYLDVEAPSSGGNFSYKFMYIQLVCIYPSGEYTMDKVCGVENDWFGNIYGDFSGTLHVDLNAGATECYLAMRCSQYEEYGKSCTISEDANSDPGYEIPGTRVSLQQPVEKPVLGNVRNTNPYNGNQGVSASENSISVAFDLVGGDEPTKLYYSFGDYWREIPNNQYSITLDGYDPGTTIFINFLAANDAGNAESLPSITIRTLYDAPAINAWIDNPTMESLRLNWSSTRPLKQLNYSIAGGYVELQVDGQSSGQITLDNLSPSTQYPVYVNGISSDQYDGRGTNDTITVYGTTTDIARITKVESITHGKDFRVVITNPSNKSCTLKLWTTGNGLRADISLSVSVGTVTVNVTESKWDEIYKTFPNSNTHTMYAQLVTHGNKDYNDNQKTSTITLTGIQKTCKTGINNTPRRVQVWVGDSSGKARRCVSWTNVSKIRRTI